MAADESLQNGFGRKLLPALFLLSGTAGLAYQTVWTRLFTNALGHEIPAMLAVVAAFFGGLTIGAWLGDSMGRRFERPGRCYVWLEVIIGSWALVTMALVPAADTLGARLIGYEPAAWRHWLVAFMIPFVTLVPATGAMGATWPAMVRFARPMEPGGQMVGTLYAANTLGALIGVGLSTFVVLPRFGFRMTLAVFALLNFLCAAVAWWIERDWHLRTNVVPGGHRPEVRRISPGAPRPAPREAGVKFSQAGKSSGRLLVTLVVTGFLGIGWEIISIRLLARVLENTIYTFAGALMVYLLGTAMGAGVYQRSWRQIAAGNLERRLLWGLALACGLSVIPLACARSLYDFARALLGSTISGGIAAEMVVALFAFAGPTFLMGALFAHLVQNAEDRGIGVGRATAANTLGSALAPLAVGVLMIPALGAKWTWVALITGYLALACFEWAARWRALIILPSLIGLLLPRHLQALPFPPGSELVAFREGRMDSVAVIRYADGNRSLVVNDRFAMGGTGAALAERRHAHIPLLLHPAPGRALFLGLGTGITFAASGTHPSLRADGVELLPEVVDVWPSFSPENSTGAARDRLRVHVADARRFVRATTNRYDVVIADLFQPSRDGAGLLYTREHFGAVRSVLAPGGIFCQWLPLYQLDEDMLKTITRTFLKVFPNTRAWLLRYNIDTPVLGLIGMAEHLTYSRDYMEQRVGGEPLTGVLKGVQLRSTLELFGGFLGDEEALRQFAGEGVLNSDDHPVVLFGAPRWSYGPRRPAHERLSFVLHGIKPKLASLVSDVEGRNAAFAAELRDFISARDAYIEGLVEEAEGREFGALEAFIESARRSENFTLGYAQALAWARQNWGPNQAGARKALEDLDRVQPGRRVARMMLEQLEKP